MAASHRVHLGDGLVLDVRFTDAADGDFRVNEPQPGLAERRRSIVDQPWSWVRQVHGADVLTVERPGDHAGAEADGLLTAAVGCPIAVTTADCAPVVLVADGGVAVVHAGWRGLVAGIIERAGAMLVDRGAKPVATILGPCISPAAYRFGQPELATVVDRLGPEVASVTADGEPALDMTAGVGAACQRAGWPAPPTPACTSDERFFSHRTRADQARQTAVAWLSRTGGAGPP